MIAHIAQRARVGALLVTDIKDFNLAFMHRIGIPDAVDPRQVDALEHGRAMTEGEGFDVVFVTSPNDDGITDAIALARPGGRVVQVAIYGRPVPVDATQAVLREVELRATLTYSPDDFRLTTAMIRDGQLDAQAFITQRYPMWDADSAFEDIAGGMNHVKVMLTV
jgi:threonine dehydrogenase-like Zn-dependent dehydrogenase